MAYKLEMEDLHPNGKSSSIMKQQIKALFKYLKNKHPEDAEELEDIYNKAVDKGYRKGSWGNRIDET
jgi:hypothetical protein